MIPNSHAKLVLKVDQGGKFGPKYQAVIRWTEIASDNSKLKREKKCDALVDDQASHNFIRRDLVEEAKLSHILKHAENAQIKLSDGKTCKALCRVPLPYELNPPKKSTDPPRDFQDFFVLPRTIAPLVLGIPFLKATGLLMNPEAANIPGYLVAYVGIRDPPNTEANTMPNRGADVDMMSKDYVDRHQDRFKTKPGGRRVFELGNGRKIAAEKEVKEARIRFGTGPSPTSRLTNPAVIQGLPADGVLSNDFLSKNRNNIAGQDWTNDPEIIDGLYAILCSKDKAIDSESEAKKEEDIEGKAFFWLRKRGKFRLDKPSEGDPDAVAHGGLPIAGGEAVRDNHHQSPPPEQGRVQGEQIEEPQVTSSVARNGHEAKSKGEWNVLDQAVANGNREVELLLLNKQDDIEATKEEGWTALQWAGAEGYEVVVQLLLESGADVEVKTEKGVTVLQLAAGRGHKAVVQQLLAWGAKVNVEDNDRWIALHRAGAKGYETVVRLLLESGADIEAKTEKGVTVLQLAAGKGHKAVVQQLLAQRAEVNIRDDDGWTALYWAARGLHEAVVWLLLDSGADVDAQDNEGWTVLYWAAGKASKEIVQLLLEKGANTELKTNSEQTALHAAAYSGKGEIVQMLLEKGASLEAKSQGGWTALQWARSSKKEAVVQLLLEKGAIIEEKDIDEWQSYAAETRNDEIVKLLEKRANVVNEENKV